MPTPVFLSAVRSPIGRINGSLRDVHTADLASAVARAAIERAGIDATAIDEVVMSETYRADLPGCSGRPVALRAGVPLEVPASNVNMHCGSGLKAIVQAGQMIRCGDARTVLVIGLESMSRTAYLLRGARQGFGLGHAALVDQLVQKGDPAKDTRFDPTGALSMGETAERLAELYGITRERQDRYAWRSHQRAVAAWEAGRFDAQIVPIAVPAGKGQTRPFARDEHPRADTTLEAFAAQTLACFDEFPELGAREADVNVNGSGISLGHPIGATGTILAVKALHELVRIGGGPGLMTMCVGGGQGIAVAIER